MQGNGQVNDNINGHHEEVWTYDIVYTVTMICFLSQILLHLSI